MCLNKSNGIPYYSQRLITRYHKPFFSETGRMGGNWPGRFISRGCYEAPTLFTELRGYPPPTSTSSGASDWFWSKVKRAAGRQRHGPPGSSVALHRQVPTSWVEQHGPNSVHLPSLEPAPTESSCAPYPPDPRGRRLVWPLTAIRGTYLNALWVSSPYTPQ